MKNKLVKFLACMLLATTAFGQNQLLLNEKNYFEMPGLNVMVFEDIYPEGHQGGIAIIQNGVRVATNGDLRLEPTPGQWGAIPRVGKRMADKTSNSVRITNTFPDSSRSDKGFNPIHYPSGLYFNYTITVKAEKDYFRIIVDLDRKLPAEWANKVSFNLELYPTDIFGKHWKLGETFGLFSRMTNSSSQTTENNDFQPSPMAVGKKLIIAPEADAQRMEIECTTGNIELIDGRIKHTNGWFVVRSVLSGNVTQKALEWIVKPNALPNWKAKPVVHVSQIGYTLEQKKEAIIELDKTDNDYKTASLISIQPDGKQEDVLQARPEVWGNFLRYNYLKFDFTKIKKAGIYKIKYGEEESQAFVIDNHAYTSGVWQPTIEYFLPVQMCHVRVEESYKVWHGYCHQDDALMAPINHNHFDGYMQGESTFCRFKSGENVDGLNTGGWHDAGDDDLRIESQAGTVYYLGLAYENFKPQIDVTDINQAKRKVLIHKPDGKNDILQQMEHGLLSIIGGYKALGRFYRGIICPTLEQYTLVGDVANQTDNIPNNSLPNTPTPDDRMVFTEQNAGHEYAAIRALAVASRVLNETNPALAKECIEIAEKEMAKEREIKNNWVKSSKIEALCEIYLSTKNEKYLQTILSMREDVLNSVKFSGWLIAKIFPFIKDEKFLSDLKTSFTSFASEVNKMATETPFGVPYHPNIWGAGWDIQGIGVRQYFLNKAFPELFSRDVMYSALNFVLGVHPGDNTASFVSGVGVKSNITAYGYNRAEWSFIPGGSSSGTSLIRPDFAELKEFPFLWQQGEYCLGGPDTTWLFLVLAADNLGNKGE